MALQEMVREVLLVVVINASVKSSAKQYQLSIGVPSSAAQRAAAVYNSFC